MRQQQPLTRDFRETMIECAIGDPEFLEGILLEALCAFENGEPEVADILIRDYVDAIGAF